MSTAALADILAGIRELQEYCCDTDLKAARDHIEAALTALEDIEEALVEGENDRIAATVYAPAVSRDHIEALIETYNRDVPFYRQVHVLHLSDQPLAKTGNGKIIRRSMTGGNET